MMIKYPRIRSGKLRTDITKPIRPFFKNHPEQD